MTSFDRPARLARSISRSKRLGAIDHLHAGAARDPNAVAVSAAGESIRYRELVQMVDALAAALQSIDPRTGNDSRVGICAKNTLEHFIALLATYAAGKVWVPLNPRNGRAELDAMIATTSPTVIVADESCVDRFTPTSAPLILAKTSAVRPDAKSVRELIAEFAGQGAEPIERGDEDFQIIKFSGGSTGAPKAVVQPVRALEAQARGLLDFFEFDARDVNLIAAPLTHGASCFVLPILSVGGRHVLIEDPKAPLVLDVLVDQSVTTMYAPPTLIYALLDVPGVDTRSFPRLQHLIYSAAPMSPERIADAQRVFGPVVETAYGQVEAPQIVTAMRAAELADERNVASIGRASSVAEVSILDESGNEVSRGEIGEICVRGPLVMSSYLGRPEQTATTIRDGWLRTGDLGFIDERGYVFIRGRLRDVINTGGFKVFPGDVEAVLAKHPAVRECCVFGLEDPKWGEAVHAAVVLRERSIVDSSELINFVKAELDSVKAPKAVHFVGELPRNAAGKVSRADVRNRFAAGG